MTHDELRDLSGGYALGILSEAERRAFEAHLSTCPECGEEVRGFAAVAQGLAQAVPLVDPPAALRARVLGAATATSHGAAAAAAPRSPRRALAFLSAAAAVVALALGLYAVSLQQRIRVLEDELRAASARAAESQQQLVQYRVASDRLQQVRSILAAPDLRRIDLAGQKAAPGASGSRVLESGSGPGRRVRQSAGDVSRSGLPALGHPAWQGRRADQCRAARPAARRPGHRARGAGHGLAGRHRRRHARACRRCAGPDRRHDRRRHALELSHGHDRPVPRIRIYGTRIFADRTDCRMRRTKGCPGNVLPGSGP